jgi:hypothetical protein
MKTYTVIVNEGRHAIEVEADYVKNENGVLLFKREVRHSHPELVRAFAPGFWVEVRA